MVGIKPHQTDSFLDFAFYPIVKNGRCFITAQSRNQEILLSALFLGDPSEVQRIIKIYFAKCGLTTGLSDGGPETTEYIICPKLCGVFLKTVKINNKVLKFRMLTIQRLSAKSDDTRIVLIVQQQIQQEIAYESGGAGNDRDGHQKVC